MGKKPIVSVTYAERIAIKNSLRYLKCVLRLSCVVHGPIYSRFMGCVNGKCKQFSLYIFGAATRMAETLLKLSSSRAGYRAHFKKTLNKARSVMGKETTTEMDVISLKNIIKQLKRKKSILQELDQKVAALLEELKNLEQEIFDKEEIQDKILETSSQINRVFISQYLIRNILNPVRLPPIRNSLKRLAVNPHSCKVTL